MAETKTASHCFLKGGICDFSRRVPTDLKPHYVSHRIACSLRTRSRAVAAARATRAARQLDEYWHHLRLERTDLPGKHLLRMADASAQRSHGTPSANDDVVKLSEAVAICLRRKVHGRPIALQRSAERACGYVIDICGDKNLGDYTRKHANAFRDGLLARGLAGSSITRIFGTVRAVTSFAAAEAGIELNNPFAGVLRPSGWGRRTPPDPHRHHPEGAGGMLQAR